MHSRLFPVMTCDPMYWGNLETQRIGPIGYMGALLDITVCRGPGMTAKLLI